MHPATYRTRAPDVGTPRSSPRDCLIAASDQSTAVPAFRSLTCLAASLTFAAPIVDRLPNPSLPIGSPPV
jgi:hypothetical protein